VPAAKWYGLPEATSISQNTAGQALELLMQSLFDSKRLTDRCRADLESFQGLRLCRT